MKRENINPVFDEFIEVCPKQVELAICIRQYRRMHNLSQKQMADICTLYGKPHNIKIYQTEIHKYENYQTIPTPPKFQVLMNTMDINPSML